MRTLVYGVVVFSSLASVGQMPHDRNLAHKRVRMDVTTASPSADSASARESRSASMALDNIERQTVRAESEAATKRAVPRSKEIQDLERPRRQTGAIGSPQPQRSGLRNVGGRSGQSGRRGIHAGWVTGR
jgi:hypothetical protein